MGRRRRFHQQSPCTGLPRPQRLSPGSSPPPKPQTTPRFVENTISDMMVTADDQPMGMTLTAGLTHSSVEPKMWPATFHGTREIGQPNVDCKFRVDLTCTDRFTANVKAERHTGSAINGVVSPQLCDIHRLAGCQSRVLSMVDGHISGMIARPPWPGPMLATHAHFGSPWPKS